MAAKEIPEFFRYRNLQNTGVLVTAMFFSNKLIDEVTDTPIYGKIPDFAFLLPPADLAVTCESTRSGFYADS